MSSELEFQFPGHFNVYKDGRIEKIWDPRHYPVPPGLDPETGVETRDVVISEVTGVKARLYLPKITAGDGQRKLPVVLHYHSGGFCLFTAFDAPFKGYLTALSSEANAMVVSIDYRLAPEHKLPIGYEDSLSGLEWVGLHSNGSGPDPWLNEYADLSRVIIVGESAGANLAHYVAVQGSARDVGPLALELELTKLIIMDPYFGIPGRDPYYSYMCPGSCGTWDDPRFHPRKDPDLGKLKCGTVLVCLGDEDVLKERGMSYYETMKECGFGGTVELYVTKGENHCFHLIKNKSFGDYIKKIANFINQD